MGYRISGSNPLSAAGAPVAGDVLFADATPAWARRAIGNSAQFLSVGSSNFPVWDFAIPADYVLKGQGNVAADAAAYNAMVTALNALPSKPLYRIVLTGGFSLGATAWSALPSYTTVDATSAVFTLTANSATAFLRGSFLSVYGGTLKLTGGSASAGFLEGSDATWLGGFAETWAGEVLGVGSRKTVVINGTPTTTVGALTVHTDCMVISNLRTTVVLSGTPCYFYGRAYMSITISGIGGSHTVTGWSGLSLSVTISGHCNIVTIPQYVTPLLTITGTRNQVNVATIGLLNNVTISGTGNRVEASCANIGSNCFTFTGTRNRVEVTATGESSSYNQVVDIGTRNQLFVTSQAETTTTWTIGTTARLHEFSTFQLTTDGNGAANAVTIVGHATNGVKRGIDWQVNLTAAGSTVTVQDNVSGVELAVRSNTAPTMAGASATVNKVAWRTWAGAVLTDMGVA